MISVELETGYGLIPRVGSSAYWIRYCQIVLGIAQLDIAQLANFR